MKFTKLVCLLCLGVSLVGCNRNNENNEDYITCKNYNGNLACYTESTDDEFIREMCQYLLHNGYEYFYIQNGEGDIEYHFGDSYEEVK